MTPRRRWSAALFLVLLPLPALAQRPAAEEVRVRTSALDVQIGGRVQTQFNTTTADLQPTGQLLIRRVRLEARVKVNDIVSGKIAPDFAGDEVSLKDAYLSLDLSPALQLLAGQAQKPFSLLEQTSSTRMLPIERGARIRGVPALEHYTLVSGLDYSDRDVGLQLLGAPAGAPLRLAYAFGAFRGPLHGAVGARDSYQLAGRATVSPLPRTRVGAGWSSRDFASPPDASTLVELRRGHAFEIDLEYGSFAPGVHVLAEVAAGDLDPFSERTFRAAQLWLGYRSAPLSTTVSSIEPVLRVSHGSVDAPAPGGTLITPGVNVHLGGLNRVMVNYDLWKPGVGDAEGSFKAMLQMAF